LPTDPATGLNLLGARQYDPDLGAFLQLDPVLEPGDPGQIGGYTYAGSDPVNASDPTGLFFGPIVLAPPAHFTSHAKNKKSRTRPRKKKNQSWWKDPIGTAGNVAGATGNALGSAGSAAWDAGTSTVNTLDPYARSIGRHLPSIVEGTTSLAGGGFAIFKGFGTAVGGCTAGAATGPGELVICTAAIAEGSTEIAIGTKRATDGIRKLGDDIQEINTEVNTPQTRGGVYTLRNESGEVVRTGRTKNLEDRKTAHEKDPILREYKFRVEYRTDNYAEQRGLEQTMYERYPGARVENGGYEKISWNFTDESQPLNVHGSG
jgi:RHS repeat-associated protein